MRGSYLGAAMDLAGMVDRTMIPCEDGQLKLGDSNEERCEWLSPLVMRLVLALLHFPCSVHFDKRVQSLPVVKKTCRPGSFGAYASVSHSERFSFTTSVLFWLLDRESFQPF